MDLRNINLSKEMIDDLVLTFKLNKSLEKLWIGNDSIKFTAVKLLHSLYDNSAFKLINIQSNNLPNETSNALATLICKNSDLENPRFNVHTGMLEDYKTFQY